MEWGVQMPTITKVQATEMYARFWAARYGSTASSSARKMANSLESKGDHEGLKVWNEVADVIDRQQQERRLASRQETLTAASQTPS
jgi:hypothetical protein